jgi:hypothetical protein
MSLVQNPGQVNWLEPPAPPEGALPVQRPGRQYAVWHPYGGTCRLCADGGLISPGWLNRLFIGRGVFACWGLNKPRDH